MYVDATSLIRSFDGYGSEGGTVDEFEMLRLRCDSVVDSHSSIGPIVIANYLRGLIRERTGCPASVGIGEEKIMERLVFVWRAKESLYPVQVQIHWSPDWLLDSLNPME